MGHDQYWPPFIQDLLRARHRADGLQCCVISPPSPFPSYWARMCDHTPDGDTRLRRSGRSPEALRGEN